MGIFAKLFGKTDRKAPLSSASASRSSMGAPLQYQCTRCGKQLHAGTGQILVGGAELLDHVSKRAHQCPACLKIFCGDCSFQSDKELGRPNEATGYSCPFCRTTGIA